MLDGQFQGGGFQGVAVEPPAQDGFDTLVTAGVHPQRTVTGGLQSLVAIPFAQPEDAQTGAKGLLGVAPPFEEGLD